MQKKSAYNSFKIQTSKVFDKFELIWTWFDLFLTCLNYLAQKKLRRLGEEKNMTALISFRTNLAE